MSITIVRSVRSLILSNVVRLSYCFLFFTGVLREKGVMVREEGVGKGNGGAYFKCAKMALCHRLFLVLPNLDWLGLWPYIFTICETPFSLAASAFVPWFGVFGIVHYPIWNVISERPPPPFIGPSAHGQSLGRHVGFASFAIVSIPRGFGGCINKHYFPLIRTIPHHQHS